MFSSAAYAGLLTTAKGPEGPEQGSHQQLLDKLHEVPHTGNAQEWAFYCGDESICDPIKRFDGRDFLYL